MYISLIDFLHGSSFRAFTELQRWHLPYLEIMFAETLFLLIFRKK